MMKNKFFDVQEYAVGTTSILVANSNRDHVPFFSDFGLSTIEEINRGLFGKRIIEASVKIDATVTGAIVVPVSVIEPQIIINSGANGRQIISGIRILSGIPLSFNAGVDYKGIAVIGFSALMVFPQVLPLDLSIIVSIEYDDL